MNVYPFRLTLDGVKPLLNKWSSFLCQFGRCSPPKGLLNKKAVIFVSVWTMILLEGTVENMIFSFVSIWTMHCSLLNKMVVVRKPLLKNSGRFRVKWLSFDATFCHFLVWTMLLPSVLPSEGTVE